MTDAQPRHRQPFHRRHVALLAVSVAAVAFSVGYEVADFDGMAVSWLPRIAVSVTAVLLIVWTSEIRMSRQVARSELRLARQLARIEERIQNGPTRPEYWKIYSDVMSDLSGVDDASTDHGRL